MTKYEKTSTDTNETTTIHKVIMKRRDLIEGKTCCFKINITYRLALIWASLVINRKIIIVNKNMNKNK